MCDSGHKIKLKLKYNNTNKKWIKYIAIQRYKKKRFKQQSPITVTLNSFISDELLLLSSTNWRIVLFNNFALFLCPTLHLPEFSTTAEAVPLFACHCCRHRTHSVIRFKTTNENTLKTNLDNWISWKQIYKCDFKLWNIEWDGFFFWIRFSSIHAASIVCHAAARPPASYRSLYWLCVTLEEKSE